MGIQIEVRQTAPTQTLKTAMKPSRRGNLRLSGRLSCWNVQENMPDLKRQYSSEAVAPTCTGDKACLYGGAAPAQQAVQLFTGVLLKGVTHF